jgi:hypothetical protein
VATNKGHCDEHEILEPVVVGSSGPVRGTARDVIPTARRAAQSSRIGGAFYSAARPASEPNGRISPCFLAAHVLVTPHDDDMAMHGDVERPRHLDDRPRHGDVGARRINHPRASQP